jgi:hypothetical protein
MPGLVPGIHVLQIGKTWMAGIKPAMTELGQAFYFQTPENSAMSQPCLLGMQGPSR